MNTSKVWDSESLKNYKTVDRIKKQIRKGNWNYLSNHPEIRAIIRVLLYEAINKKPSNIYDFAAQIFNTENTAELITMINGQLKNVNAHLKKGRWSEYDGEMIFGETKSSHSLVSETSVSGNIESLLQYSFVLQNPSENK